MSALFVASTLRNPNLSDFRRQLDPRLHLRWVRGRVRRRGPAASFRSGTVVQADLLTSEENTSPAGGLRSPGVTPVPRYYAPLRLPAEPGDGYAFPPPVVLMPCPGAGHSTGSLRFLMDQSTPAVPYHPGSSTAACARCLAVDVRLRQLGKVGRSRFRFHEAELDSLALRLTSSRSQAPTVQLPAPPLSQLHGERAISMVSSFQLTRSTRLTLTHPSEPNF